MLQKAYTTYLKTALIVFSFLLFCVNRGFTQTNCLQSFQVSFGGSNDDIAYDVVDAGNGQYYTAGTTKSFGAGNTDILVTKIAGDGSVVWSYAYGAGGDETVRKISATPDGGLVLTGQTKSFSQSQGEIFCMKINSGGHLDWSKRFGDKNDGYGDLGLNIIPTSDGGYAFTGIFNVAGHIGDLVIAKLDTNGNISWFKRMNSNQGEDGTGLLQEGNELLVASDLDNNGTNYSSVVMRLNINTGIVVSQVEIKPAARGLFGPFLYKDKNGDGYWISAHTTDGYSYSQMQPVILKLDNSFKLVKTYSFKVPGIYTNDYFTGFTQMDNGFVVCASTQSNPTGYLFYINTNGSIKWAKKFAGTNGRSLYRLQHLGSKIIAVGKDASQGKGNDFFVEGFGDGGTIDQLCHPDTTAVTITAPAFTENNFTWSSVKNQLFDDISAPVTVSPVTITAKSLCDACPVNVTPSFTVPDTVCVGSPVTINNTTTGASSYFWNFCTADINAAPEGKNLGNIGGFFTAPVFTDIVSDGGKFYTFVTNYASGSLVRLDFGTSMLNTPTATFLGSFGGQLPVASTEGLQVVKNEGKWYAIIVGGGAEAGTSPKVVKLSFGTSITNNNPVLTDWGNIDNKFNFPHDFQLFEDGGKWFGFAIDKGGNTLSRIDFTSSFENTPTVTTIVNPPGSNLNLATGFFVINDAGQWHIFVANSYDEGENPPNDGTITRFDFGSSLFNTTPKAVNMTNSQLGNTLHNPRDIYVIKFCGDLIGFVVNHASNDIVRLNFNDDILSVPTAKSLGNIGNLNFPHSISELFRVGADVYTFIPNAANNTITRLKFAGCTNASTPNSTAKNPPPVTYSTPGVYNINLTVDDGLATQASICKQVFVKDCKTICTANPDFSFKQDACNPKLFQFTNETENTVSVAWDFGNGKKAGNDLTPAITYGAYGNYNVKLFVQTTGGCIDSVSKNISVNVVNDSLIITNDTTLCNPKSLQLNAVPALNYCWSPAKGLSATDIANPMANITSNITYYVTTQSTGKNLIVNGDFSQGNTGFTSGYTYASPKNITEGQYNVDIDSHVWNLGMASCGDHSGNGNMMMINGNPQPDLQVWSETITVKPNTTYAFSAWLEPLHSQNPAALQFYINGKTIGSVFNAVLPTCNWKQFYVTWNSGDTNKATISIINKNTILVGNDFALDDISFAESTIKTDSIVIKVGVQGAKISPDTTICSGGSAQMAAKVPGSITYKWSPATGLNNAGVANPIAAPVNTTTYRVDATTINGCKITDSVKVSVLPQPAVTTIADTAICNGEAIQLTTASNGGTFSWLPATGLSDASLQSPQAKPTKNTQYIVTVNPGTLCSIKDTVNINVKPLPVVKVSNDTTLCSGASTQLTATSAGNVTYGWLPATGLNDATINNPVANPSVTTRYNVQVKGANGCTNTDSILVTVLPQPFVNTIADTAICSGTTIQLTTASNGSTYHWSPGAGLSGVSQQSPSAKPLANTQYVVTVNPGTQCSIKDTVNITVNQSPALKVSNDTALCEGTAIQLKAVSPGNVTYSWSPAAGLDDVTINNPVANPSATTQYDVLVTGANGCTSTDSVLVTVLPQPFVNTIADTAICSGTTILLTTASNGSTYHWSPGAGLSGVSQQSPLAKPSASTQYVVTVNPGTQCSIKDTVNITVTQSPPLQVSNDTTLCSGTSVQLKAISPVNVAYSWLPDASLSDITISNPIATPTVTTKYFVQVKGADGCFSTDSINVSVLPQPAVTAMADTTICNGTSVRLTTSVANGNTYSWSPATGLSNAAQQNPLAKPTITTQYIITVNPGALCIAKDTINIAVKPAPALQLPKDTTLCSGTSTQIVATSPDAVSYSWLPATGLNDASSSNPVASPLTTTKYLLQVTGSNGCNNTDSIVISVLPQPAVATIADTAICLGAPVALITSATDGNTYSWSPATGLSNPSAQSPVANPTSQTQYIVTVNKGSLCTAQDTVNITVNALPALQASGDTTLCSGASVQLNAASSNNVTYSWSPATGLNNPAVNNPVASPVLPTIYTVKAIDGNKCTAQASVTVNVIPKPVFGITPANKQICVGDPLTLTASGGDIYQWGPAETVVSPTAASTQVKPVSNTNYQVVIVNSTCKLSDTLYSSIVVTNKLTTTVTKSNDLDCVLASTTLQATGGNQYSWSPNININQPNIPNPVVSPLETTTYYVVIKKNGCEVKDSITVVVTPANADNAYKMASAFTPNGDGLNDCFGVKYWGGIKTFLFEVYNRWGNRLFYTTDPSKCWDGTYKGQYQPTGTYVYQIKAETICGNIYKKGTVVIIR